ncbi:hypothetical protein DPMN_107261 [Dreissena polymorpha]|uniref:Reverse transcriptase n=1 Tax=Dreissena polymorpha TaxID=45954 RepID=A0A9D4K6E1_DREPO|nr:hypothetical protein DPMN_107261 [Dreissena polymorpha]
MQTLHFRRKKYVSDLKPYWNSELTAAHDSMSLVRREWCRQGRPRDATGQAFSAYKTAKREFRRLHRKCLNIYLSNLNNEIDRMAEVDSHKFWKMVNARRNRNRSSLSSGIKFDGTTVRDRDSISDGWYHYFRELFQPHHDPDDVHSSDTWEKHVSSELDFIVTNIKPDPEVRVLPETVDHIISTCPKRKAGGYDNLQYEHLINAKHVISPVLANIYTWMLRTGHVPDSMKRGVIITMHAQRGEQTS